MTAASLSTLHLQADTETVESLMTFVRRGNVRVPDFQRPSEWESDDVQLLFDSIYHGFPIGSLLMRKAMAPAATLKYGPVTITAPETHGALWVVDGQQRLTALTGVLAREKPIPRTPEDAWVLYFDAKERSFHTPNKSGEFATTWVPVTELLDASTLSEWVFKWKHKDDDTLRRNVFDAGARIRQYEIPLYIVETEDENSLRDIFHRVNNSGHPLKWEHIHDALFGRKTESPSTLEDLAQALESLGLGRPEKDQLLSALFAFKGLDVTRSISDHYRRNPEVLRDAVRDALPALKNVIAFFKTHAHIPHLRLLPRSFPLIVLTRFFGLYPEPSHRTLELLVRWMWRTLLNISYIDERTALRHSVAAIRPNEEEASVQRMLAAVPRNKQVEFKLPRRFDARAAESRIAVVALASLRPRQLDDEAHIDIAKLIEAQGIEAFRRIFTSKLEESESPANRILLPGRGSARKDLQELLQERIDIDVDAILLSHAIDRECISHLSSNALENFLNRRKQLIEKAVEKLGTKLAAWGKNDRPSVGFLINLTEDSQ